MGQGRRAIIWALAGLCLVGPEAAAPARVRDLRLRKTIIFGAGQTYLAKAP